MLFGLLAAVQAAGVRTEEPAERERPKPRRLLDPEGDAELDVAVALSRLGREAARPAAAIVSVVVVASAAAPTPEPSESLAMERAARGTRGHDLHSASAVPKSWKIA